MDVTWQGLAEAILCSLGPHAAAPAPLEVKEHSLRPAWVRPALCPADLGRHCCGHPHHLPMHPRPTQRENRRAVPFLFSMPGPASVSMIFLTHPEDMRWHENKQHRLWEQRQGT
jgi:hypothetical protein